MLVMILYAMCAKAFGTYVLSLGAGSPICGIFTTLQVVLEA